MLNIKVIALDPGVTTGYATGVIDINGSIGVVSGQAKWREVDLFSQLNLGQPQYIVYERFEYRPPRKKGKQFFHDNVNLFPRNLIGVINLFLQQHPEVLYHTQMPATVLGADKYWTDDRLKKFGCYKVSNPHANDAMRHLLYWAKFGPGFKYVKDNAIEALA